MPSWPVVVGEPDPVFRALRARRTWLWVLVGAVLGAAVGAAWLLSSPKTFKATVAIELTDIASTVNLSGVGPKPDAITVDTDAQLVISDSVVNAVASADDRSAEAVRQSLAVSARPLTSVMTITYESGSSARALLGASTAADAFLGERERLIVKPVRDYLSTVTKQRVAGTGTAGEVTTESEANLWSLELRRQAALTTELGLQGAGTVVEQARITVAGERGNLEVPIATGIAMGGLAGLGAAMLRASRRRARRRGHRT